MILSLGDVIVRNQTILTSVYRQGRNTSAVRFLVDNTENRKSATPLDVWNSKPTDTDFIPFVCAHGHYPATQLTDEIIGKSGYRPSNLPSQRNRTAEETIQSRWNAAFEIVVSPDEFSKPEKPTSTLAKCLERIGIKTARIAEPFSVGQAEQLFRFLGADGLITMEGFPQGNKLIAELERGEDKVSSVLMAFLQGVVVLDDVLRNKGSKLFYSGGGGGHGMRVGGMGSLVRMNRAGSYDRRFSGRLG